MKVISRCTRKLILLAVVAPLVASTAQAGTGGIFPSNNPRRKIQMMMPIEMPTSLTTGGENGGRKRSALPVVPATPGTLPIDSTPGSDNKPPLHGIGMPSSDAAGLSGSASVIEPDHGSVESFFQVNSANKFRQSPDIRATKSIEKLDAELDSASTKSGKSVISAPYRLLWHVMDNAGIPMFFGNKDDDLDPSLRPGYARSVEGVQQPSIEPNALSKSPKPGTNGSSSGDNGLRANVNSTSSDLPGADISHNHGTESGAQPAPHKIPESELEGPGSWMNNNDEMP